MPKIHGTAYPSLQDAYNTANFIVRRDTISATPVPFAISKAASPNATVIGNIAGSGIYSIVSGNGAGAFAINASTGQLTVLSQAALTVGVAALSIQYGTASVFDIVEVVITVSA